MLEAIRETWPDACHTVIEPDAKCVKTALASDADILAGFSFGAHLLLSVDDPRPRILLAPFVDLKKEADLGGAVATTQLRQQLRWLKRDPAAAIADFHIRIGSTTPLTAELRETEALIWGLEQMLAPAQTPVPRPAGSILVAGRNDPLLDTAALLRALPDLHLADCGHQLQPLLAAALNLRQNGAA